MKKLLIPLILLIVCYINAQTDEKSKISQLNQDAVALFKSQKFDDAIKVSNQSLELTNKVYGIESSQAAIIYLNLGFIYREKKKYGDSSENFQKAIGIYLKLGNVQMEDLISIYQNLGYSQVLDKNIKEATLSYLKVVELSEKKFGSESKDAFQPSLNLATLYAQGKNFEEADQFYLKSYRIAVKHFGTKSEEVEKVADSRICLGKDDKKKDKSFKVEYDKIFGNDNIKPEDIINGKALNLIKPPYPAEAKAQRLSGDAKIRVWIDEKGSVYKTRPACGNGVLEKSSEEAALISKFSPTLVAGKPVKVTGVIIYRFRVQ